MNCDELTAFLKLKPRLGVEVFSLLLIQSNSPVGNAVQFEMSEGKLPGELAETKSPVRLICRSQGSDISQL